MVFSVDTAIEEGAAAAAGSPEIVRIYDGAVIVSDAVYQKTDGKVARASAADLSTSEKLVGFVSVVDSPFAGQCKIRFSGDLDTFSGLEAGKLYILSTNPGKIVKAEDTGHIDYPDTTPGSGDVVREVGNAANATTLFVEASRDFEEY